MAKGRLTFEQLLPRAWAIVDEWAAKWASGSLPVPLEDLARAYKVRRVEFEPLLSTGGLEQEEDEFVVYLNPEADGVDQRDGDTMGVAAGAWSALRSPVRFTLAHELAHLILYSLANYEHRPFEDRDKDLETACNDIAGALLLPKKRLMDEIGGHLFDTHHIRTVLKKFHVSGNAFVLRLRSHDLNNAFDSMSGLMTVVRKVDGKFAFDAAYACGSYIRQGWKRLQASEDDCSPADLGLNMNLLDEMLASDEFQRKTTILWHADAKEVIPCDVASCRTSRSTTLIAIKLLGGPVKETPDHGAHDDGLFN
jgi:hypothetical protein